MFEVLSLIGIVVIAVTLLRQQNSGGSDVNSKAQPIRAKTPIAAQKVVAKPAPERISRTESNGATESVPRDGRFAFVAGFGVRPDQLKELHVYSVAGTLEQFPRKVIELLGKLYDNGFAVGDEIMALIHHGRPLKEGEAIYVAVARDDRANVTRTVAFIDRRRAC